jgi:septum formation protein
MPQKTLILASNSPRRRLLLAEAGYRFQCAPAKIAEPEPSGGESSPEQWAQALAYFKAREVADRCGPGHVVLGADTVVALGSQTFGKAETAEQARATLATLSHNPHRVITSLALIDTDTDRRLIDFEVSQVTMKPMSDEQIEDYVQSGSWQDKAGAYALQEGADKYVTQIVGSYDNVVGLPVTLARQMLAAFGIHPETPFVKAGV